VKLYHFVFFFLKSTEMSEFIPSRTDSLMFIEDTSLFIEYEYDPLDDLDDKLSLLIFSTLAFYFSPFFRFAKLESPDFTLDTF